MLRVSKLTDYATVVMTCLAGAGDGVLSAQALAERSRLETPTVSKLLKQLAQAGLVVSTRGINGGYRLARLAQEITIADIVIGYAAFLATTLGAEDVLGDATQAWLARCTAREGFVRARARQKV